MFGSFLPSLWSSSNQSLLGSREPTLLCNQVDSGLRLRAVSARSARRVRVSEERRRRKVPLVRSVRAPRAKTNGVAVNLVSAGEKNQKAAAATARTRYRTERRGWYSRSPAKFSKKNSRRDTRRV